MIVGESMKSEALKQIWDSIIINKSKQQFRHSVYLKKARPIAPLDVREFLKGLAGVGGVKFGDVGEYIDNDDKLNELVEELKERSTLSKEDSDEVYRLKSLWCLSYKSGDTVSDLFFDPNLNKEVDIFTRLSFQMELTKYMPAEEAKELYALWFKNNHKTVAPVYIRGYQKFYETNYGYWEYNLYNVPAYRELKADPDNPKLELFFNFMGKLFPNKDHRRKVFEWVTASMFKRQDLALCLIGLQGTGKTLFSKVVMALHGKGNSFAVKEMAGGFNEYLKNKTIILFDEAKVDQAQNEAFKREMNEYVGIQEKFKNQKEIKNECSIILAANYHRNLYLTPNDRRFFLPDMATVRLQEFGFTKEEMDTIFDLSNDEYFLAALYNFLIDEFDYAASEQMQMYVTPGFEKACLMSAPAFYRRTINMLTEKTSDGRYVNDYVDYAQVHMDAMRMAERRLIKAGEIPSETEWLNSIIDYWVGCKKIIKADVAKSRVYLEGSRAYRENNVGNVKSNLGDIEI